MVRRARHNVGFTLIETILAATILSAAVLVISAISSRALNSTKLNRQYEVARQLADRQLTIINYMGIEQFLKSGEPEGEYEGYEPKYNYVVDTAQTNIDKLYEVSVTVSWVERSMAYDVKVQTRMATSGSLDAGGDEESSEQESENENGQA